MKRTLYTLLFTICFGTAFAQNIAFSDANFKNALLSADSTNNIAKNLQGNFFKIDANSDSEISVSEALEVSWLDVSYGIIADMSGVENFISLKTLNCSRNNIVSLNLSTLSNLEYLDCNNNRLTSLHVQELLRLNSLICKNNQLDTLNVLGMQALQYLDCSSNLIQHFDIYGLQNLQYLFCYSNLYTTFDVSGLFSLIELGFGSVNLTTLNIKNGINEEIRILSNSPSLRFICADIGDFRSLTSFSLCGFCTPIPINFYCSFTPGGNYNTIQGNIKYDSGNNGCDNNDINADNIRLNISDNTNFGSTVTDANGNYVFYTDSLNLTLTPFLSNNYFTISPDIANITFPNDSNHVTTQNFCITPVGIHNDVEVSLIPISAARPGFNASYKIVYTNKGNQMMNGNVTFGFDDDYLDYVNASQTPNLVNTGLLSWDYTGLMPFESRAITLTMRVHTPMDNLPVNGGDNLGIEAIIYPIAGDETLNDNQSELKQLVVNSFDPNDKTCVQGDRLDITKVGDYLDYVIRFENTGTAEAVNIVVTDTIDMNMFDINSLVPISGSHTFVTRIKNNKVEFIFENINLPFDDANNDGYVAFKIKTKPTLTLGTSIQNRAAIYFDFNFPIITNRTSTVVSNLTNVENINNHVFVQITPNPAKDLIQIQSSEIVESIEIQDVSGKIIQKTLSKNDIKTMNIAHLQKGLYFLKINTAKGFKVVRLLKE